MRVAELAIASLFCLGCWGLGDLVLHWAAERQRRGRLPWALGPRAAGRAWRPVRRPAAPAVGAVLGLAGGGLLWAAGIVGLWPAWLPLLGGTVGFAWQAVRGRQARAERAEALLAVLEELALALPAVGYSIAPALRQGAPGDGPAKQALRAAMAGGRLEREGATAVLGAWGQAFEPQLLGPLAAAVQAAVDAGAPPGAVLWHVADEAADELLARALADLKALPEAALPLLGLGLFLPVLGLLMVPVVALFLSHLGAATGGVFGS